MIEYYIQFGTFEYSVCVDWGNAMCGAKECDCCLNDVRRRIVCEDMDVDMCVRVVVHGQNSSAIYGIAINLDSRQLIPLPGFWLHKQLHKRSLSPLSGI